MLMPALSQALIQNITYENTDTDNPTTGTRTIRFVFTDGDGGTSVGTDATITVSGTNDAPMITSGDGADHIFLTQAENTTVVTTINVTDPDTDVLNFSLSGDDASWFNIDAQGVLQFRNAPDFESPVDSDHNGHYDVQVTVDDGQIRDHQQIQVQITNRNEAPSAIHLSVSQVDEHTDTRTGLAIATLTSTDPDGTAVFTYTLVGGADVSKFHLGGEHGDQLILTDGWLDFETQASYDLIIRSTDAQGLSVDQIFTVSVRNISEAQAEDQGSSGAEAADDEFVFLHPEGIGPMVVVDANLNFDSSFDEGSDHSGGHGQPHGAVAAPPVSQMIVESPEPIEIDAEATPSIDVIDHIDAQDLLREMVLKNRPEGIGVFPGFQPLVIDEALMIELDNVQHQIEQMHQHELNEQLTIKFVTHTSSLVFVAGLVKWALQSSSLVASMVTSLPLWRSMDPIPVVMLSDAQRKVFKSKLHQADQWEGRLKRILDQ